MQPGPWTVAGARDHRPSALRLPRHDARRRPPLLRRRRRAPLHRPDLAVQGQRPAPAPHRRPGLAAHGAGLAAPHRGRAGRATSTAARAASTAPPTTRRIVGLRRRALHRGRPRDRRPRPRLGRPRRLPGAELRRRRCPRRSTTAASPRSRCVRRPTRPTTSSATCSTPSPPSRAGTSTSAATRRSARSHDDFLQFVPASRRARRRTRPDAGDVARSGPGGAATGQRRAVLGCRPGRGDRARPPRRRPGRPADPVAGQPRLPRHEVRRGHAARAGVGRPSSRSALPTPGSRRR